MCSFVVIGCYSEEKCCVCDILYVILGLDLEYIIWRFCDLFFGVFLECGVEEVFDFIFV